MDPGQDPIWARILALFLLLTHGGSSGATLAALAALGAPTREMRKTLAREWMCLPGGLLEEQAALLVLSIMISIKSYLIK